jgi:spore germination protein KC
MKRKILILLIWILTIPIISGCWNQKELTDIAFVMGMGIDKGEDDDIKVTLQIVIPGNVSIGQTAGGQGLPVVVYRSSGSNVTEAVRKATQKIPRKLYYAHLNIVAFNEELAREGIMDYFDGIERDPEFRETTRVVIARDTTAEDLISTLTPLEKLPVNNITKILETTEVLLGENMQVNIDDIISGFLSTGKEPVISGFKISGNKEEGKKAANLETTKDSATLEAHGLAIFREGKLTGWMDGENARGVVWVLDKAQSSDVSVNWKGKENAISVTSVRTKTKVSATVKNGEPTILVEIDREGTISEANVAIDLTDPKEMDKIGKKVEKEVKKQVVNAIKTAQNHKSDIFGFGEKIHKADPKLWRKLEGDWNDKFADLEVTVKVNAFVRRTGVRTNPFMESIKK